MDKSECSGKPTGQAPVLRTPGRNRHRFRSEDFNGYKPNSLTSACLVVDPRTGRIGFYRRDSIFARRRAAIGFAGSNDLAVAGLEIEHWLSGGIGFSLIPLVQGRIRFHRCDAVFCAGLLFVTLARQDDLSVARFQSETELSCLVLVQFEFTRH